MRKDSVNTMNSRSKKTTTGYVVVIDYKYSIIDIVSFGREIQPTRYLYKCYDDNEEDAWGPQWSITNYLCEAHIFDDKNHAKEMSKEWSRSSIIPIKRKVTIETIWGLDSSITRRYTN